MKKTNKQNKKNMKDVKILTIVFAIVLVTLISFFGIYKQNKNTMSNTLKDYKYSMAINGKRVLTLEVDDSTKSVTKDKDGNVVENATENEIKENGYVTEDVAKNSQDILTKENYLKVKKVLEKRLKKLNVEEFNVSLNQENGKITVEIPENKDTDSVVADLLTVGKFEIIDSESKEVLLNNDNIKSSDVLYSSTQNGTAIYLQIAFDKDGKNKLKEISTTYKTDDNNTTSQANTIETENNVETSNTESTTENTKKQITMKLDDEEILTTSFDEPITTGKIQLSVGTASTDVSKLEDYRKQASSIATAIDSGSLPISYKVNKNEYVLSNITKTDLLVVEVTIAVVFVIGLICLIKIYKKLGVYASIAFVGFAALYMLTIRYTNVMISIESILGIFITLLFDYIFTGMLLNNIKEAQKAKEEKVISKSLLKTYSKFFVEIIPFIFMAILFTFMKWIPLSSFGMVEFWGISIIAIYNAIITNTLLKLGLQK